MSFDLGKAVDETAEPLISLCCFSTTLLASQQGLLTEHTDPIVEGNNDRLTVAREHRWIVGIACPEFVGVAMYEEEYRQLMDRVVI